MEGRVVFISCYCDTSEKIEVLSKNLDILESTGVKTFLFSGLPLPEYIQERSSFSFVTEENPILKWPDKSTIYWSLINTPKGTVRISNVVPDYGYAHLNQIKRFSEMITSYDFDQVFYMIYDTVLGKYEMEFLTNFTGTRFHPFQRPDRLDSFYPIGLHLFGVEKKDIVKISSSISLEEYCKDFSNPESFFEQKIVIPNGFSVGSEIVSDWIYYYSENSSLSHSPSKKIDFTVIRDYYSSSDPLKIFIWKVCEGFNEDVSLIVNGRHITCNLFELINIGCAYSEINSISLIVGNEFFDMSKIMGSISQSSIDFI